MCLSGLTPAGIETACEELLECGTNYRHLVAFSRPPVMDSFYQAGLIFQAFTGAVRKYLQHYRGCVLSVPHGTTLMQLKCIIHKVIKQIRY